MARLLEEVPDEWVSGAYLIQFTAEDEPAGRSSSQPGQDAILIVRPKRSQPRSPIVVQLGVNTWNAYHIWQNRNLYIGDVGDPSGYESASLRAHQVSFHRPGVGLEPRSRISVFPPTAYMYLLPFVQWAREEQLELDYCTGLDIDRDKIDLNKYNLLVTIGHDEYWSRRQRDLVEVYITNGGNAAFLGGNVSYWQARVIDDGTAIQCYKRMSGEGYDLGWDATPLDPKYRDPAAYPEHDNSEVTVEYHTPPLDRPTTNLTGLSMRNDDGAPMGDREGVYCGAGWWWENFGGPSRPAKGFTVTDASHWVYAGTGLCDGDTFGEEKKLIGFECDGIDLSFAGALPRPTFRDGAPRNLEMLAYADCSDWAEMDYSDDPPSVGEGRRMNRAAVAGAVAMICWQSAGGGCVFAGPVTDWPRALVDLVDYTDIHGSEPRIIPRSDEVRTITRNVLTRLRVRKSKVQ